MSHRTQITLEDEQYARLQSEAKVTGLGLAELVRRAVDQVYGSTDRRGFERALDLSFGAWSHRTDPDAAPDGESYVDQIRTARRDRFAGL